MTLLIGVGNIEILTGCHGNNLTFFLKIGHSIQAHPSNIFTYVTWYILTSLEVSNLTDFTKII